MSKPRFHWVTLFFPGGRSLVLCCNHFQFVPDPITGTDDARVDFYVVGQVEPVAVFRWAELAGIACPAATREEDGSSPAGVLMTPGPESLED